MAKKKGLPAAKQNSPKESTAILSQDEEKVKTKLRELRESHNLTAREIVAEVQKLYPKYDKTLQSKCENEEYGIELRRKAFDAILKKYAPELLAKEKHRRNGYHRLNCQVSCRLEAEEFAELKKQIRADGFDTMQAWLAFQIRKYLKEVKK